MLMLHRSSNNVSMGIPPLVRACVMVLSSALIFPFTLHAAVQVHVEKQPNKMVLGSDAPAAPLERPAEFVIERSTNDQPGTRTGGAPAPE